MAKIREDLVGVVTVGEYVLRAGDDVPGDVTVGDHVLQAEAEKPKAEPKRRKSSDTDQQGE